MIKVMIGNHAAAYGALLAQPAVVCAYPITPQTQIPEKMSEFDAEGLLKGRFINVESEMTALSYVTGASYGGVRVFTATAGPGLAWMHEGLPNASAQRLPIVMVDVSRPLPGGPPDSSQDDTLSERGCGWVQLYCESNQEVLDTVLQAYRLAESVYLPVMVCIDSVFLSFMSETVDVPDQELVDRYLPPYDPAGRALVGQRVLNRFRRQPSPTHRSEPPQRTRTAVRYALHKAELQSIGMAQKADQEFKAIFGRSYPLVEEYKCDGADVVLVTVGATTGTARDVIDKLQEQGHSVGLVKLKMFRPFPRDLVRKALNGRKKILVIERDLSVGQCGVFYEEIKWALYGNIPIYGFVGCLGSEDMTPQLIEKAIMYTLEHEPPQEEVIWLGLDRKEEKDDYDRNTIKVF